MGKTTKNETKKSEARCAKTNVSTATRVPKRRSASPLLQQPMPSEPQNTAPPWVGSRHVTIRHQAPLRRSMGAIPNRSSQSGEMGARQVPVSKPQPSTSPAKSKVNGRTRDCMHSEGSRQPEEAPSGQGGTLPVLSPRPPCRFPENTHRGGLQRKKYPRQTGTSLARFGHLACGSSPRTHRR